MQVGRLAKLRTELLREKAAERHMRMCEISHVTGKAFLALCPGPPRPAARGTLPVGRPSQ